MNARTKATRGASSNRDIFPPRIAALRKRIAKWNVDALLVTNPRDIHYLTVFTGEDSWAVVGASTGKVDLISDFRFEEQIKRDSPQSRLHLRSGAIAVALQQVAASRHIGSLALQREYMTLGQRGRLAKALRGTPLKAVDDGLLEQRAIKDAVEVAAIGRALRIQQEAFVRTVATIEPGQTEASIAARLEYEMRILGADGVSFPSIVAVDANASLPHAVPGSRKVKRGSLILIDWGARWHGYCSDLTRVVAVGKMKPKLREIYQVVLDAQQAAIAAIKPGRSLKDVDAAARSIISAAGYAKHFGHGLGHGIGLDIHEQPTLSHRSKGELKPGHVVTVEPGIYLSGVGGVRIEDDVLVTETGHRVLSDLPSDLESAII